jgi:N-acetylglucosamine malate deacetylase 2
VSRAVSGLGAGDHLPPWRSVLAVVAHPDDESFGLGAVLAGFADAGAAVAVLCFTRGESSTLHGVPGDLASVRAAELASAARVLGVDPVRLLGYPDGALAEVDVDDLSAHVLDLAGQVGADGLLVFDADGVTGHPDHPSATLAALAAADSLGLAVLGWTVPRSVASTLNQEYVAEFTGHEPWDIDLVVTLDRTRQLAAVTCHPSQAIPGSLLWRRLDLLGDTEFLCWLRRHPDPIPNPQKDLTSS